MPLLDDLARKLNIQLPGFLAGLPQLQDEEDLTPAFKQQLSKAISQSYTFPNPYGGQPVIASTPDRYYAQQAILDPNNPDTFKHDALTPAGVSTPRAFRKLGLQYYGITPKQGTPTIADMTQLDPSILHHEAIHQLDPKDVFEQFGRERYRQIDPMISKMPDPFEPAQNYTEYPAYLFGDPQDIGYGTPTQRAALDEMQKRYLTGLRSFSPNTADKLQRMEAIANKPDSGDDAMRKWIDIVRRDNPSLAATMAKQAGLTGSEKGDGVAELQRPNDTF